MKKIIYIVGNPLVEEDSLPIKLAPELQKAFPDIEFREFDPTENLPEDSEEMVLIDTVEGLKEPQVFSDIEKLLTQKNYSMHDFDLGWQLKLYKKLGMIKSIKIIGIPQNKDQDKILNELKKQVKSIKN